MQTGLVHSARCWGPGCVAKQVYVTFSHICHSYWRISQFSVIQLQNCGFLGNYVLRKNAERTNEMAYNCFSFMLWWPLPFLSKERWATTCLGLYNNNNNKAQIAAPKGDNALFMCLFNLFFVAQPLRWSSDSAKLFISSTAFDSRKIPWVCSTQRNSACGENSMAGK